MNNWTKEDEDFAKKSNRRFMILRVIAVLWMIGGFSWAVYLFWRGM